MRRRPTLPVAVVALVLLVGTAGCLASPEDSSPTVAEPSTPATATPHLATTSGTPTATVHDFEFAPDSETPVQLTNEWSEPVEMRVTVVRTATNETVHDESYELSPSLKPWSVYDLASTNPEAGERFTVAVDARTQTERVTVTTTECADVSAVVDDGGNLTLWATC